MPKQSQGLSSTPDQRSNTVGEALTLAYSKCASAGVPSPEYDATELMAASLSEQHARSITRMDLLMPGSSLLEQEVPDAFWERILKRQQREPLQYILGTAPFYGLDIAVGPGVFIPRPETELLVEWTVNAIMSHLPTRAPGRDHATALRILDICSGSGTISLALAQELSRKLPPEYAIEIIGVELSAEALDYARENARSLSGTLRNNVTVEFSHHDALDLMQSVTRGSSSLTHWADVVVSNPPYVPEITENAPTPVSPEVQADPHDAVFSGNDGMLFIREMMPAVSHLFKEYSDNADNNPVLTRGLLAVEHDDSTAPEVVELAQRVGFDSVKSHLDFAQKPRFVTAEHSFNSAVQ